MKRVIIYLFCTLLLIIGSASAGMHDRFHHGPRGFGHERLMTVSEVRKNIRDGQMVFLQGRLTKYYGGEYYEFTDLQGDTIEVKLDSDRNWSYLKKDEPIDLIGKLDKDMFSIKIKVKKAYPTKVMTGSGK